MKQTASKIDNKPAKESDKTNNRAQAPVQELIDLFHSLPHENEQEGSDAERIWKRNKNKLRNMVLNHYPDNFLRWDVILETMFVGNERYIITELNKLKKKGDWKNRWQTAIDESVIGDPIPFYKYPRSSGNLIHHAYHLAQFEEKTGLNIHDFECILEFGGGYGCMTRLISRLDYQGRYIIFDLPHFTALQRYYLQSVGMPIRTTEQPDSPGRGVVCISHLKDLETWLVQGDQDKKSLFIAAWSFSEVPLSLRDRIIPMVSHFDAFLFAYNNRFEEIDNVSYFESLKKNHLPHMAWRQWEIEHLKNNNYMTGRRKDRFHEEKSCFPENPSAVYALRSHLHGLSQKQGVVSFLNCGIKVAFRSFFQILSLRRYFQKKTYQRWLNSGRLVPPPNRVKQLVVTSYGKRYQIDLFIETGTYLGEMIDAVKTVFKSIYSIELSRDLYQRATNKFKRFRHILILEGDSSNVLPLLLSHIDRPCLFWFDAHYSEGITAKGEKETPILEELKHIFNHPIEDHVILIDDARCFTGENDYPTIGHLKNMIHQRYPNHLFEVKDDIIRIHRASSVIDSSGGRQFSDD